MTERASIRFGKRTIDFSIQRSSRRRKTVAIVVDPEQGVLLKAPAHVDQDTLKAIALDKGRWITQKIKGHEEMQIEVASRELVSGESIRYLGRNYILKIIPDKLLTGTGFCRLKGKSLEIYVPQHFKRAQRDITIQNAIRHWYKEKADQYLSARVSFYAERMGLSYGQIMIREQKKRWASCDSRGNLRFNWQIIMAPPSLIDYVVVHELCHIRIRNHSKAFWNLLKSTLPDYKERKEVLRQDGRGYSL